MIHKFEQGGLFIVHDVNSGAVHVVDEIVYDVLDYLFDQSTEEIVSKLEGKYDKSSLIEVIKELTKLQEMEQLFSPDKYIDAEKFKSKDHIIKALCLHVAHDCNIRCEYCFASQGDFEGVRSLMNLETGKKALEFLVKNSGNRRNLEVDFFGGEPLMNFDVVKELVAYGRELEKEYKKVFRFTLTTNAVMLTDEHIAYINEHMHNIVLSIDGRKDINDKMRYNRSGSGTYDQIVPKIKKVVESRGDKFYYVRGTFTSHNLDFSKDVIHMADLGFKNTSVEPVVAEPGNHYAINEEHLDVVKKEYESLADEMIRRKGTDDEFNFFHFNIDLAQGPCLIKRVVGCGAGAEYVAVTPEGDIYPCHQFVGNEDFKMGNVNKSEFNTDINKEFAGAHVYKKEDCKECWAKYYCSGGCHANAYNFNKDIMKPYKVGCEMEKKRIECALYIKAKELLERGN